MQLNSFSLSPAPGCSSSPGGRRNRIKALLHGIHTHRRRSADGAGIHVSEMTFGTIVMADKRLLRLSATLLLTGEALSAVLQFPHPAGGPTYEVTFENYAASSNWAVIHLGQFIGSAVLLAGLLVLFFALNVSEGMEHWLGFFGAVSAGVALALTGVLYAVDGVALKQAVDAWASARAAEKATRLASAESIRWLEWGINSYWN